MDTSGNNAAHSQVNLKTKFVNLIPEMTGSVKILTFFLVACCLIACDTKPKSEKIDMQKRVNSILLQEPQPEKQTDEFVFGFDLRRSIVEDTRQYVPFLKYLEEATHLKFKLRFTPQDAHIADDLGKGRLQFAAIGAGTYIVAHEKYEVIPLVRGLNTKNRAEYQSVLITPPNSSINTIDDLRGKRFAFGSKTSTQGHLIPRIILAQHNIMLKDLSGFAWTGSHSNCANEVAAGKFDAGGMQDTLGFELAEAGIIKILFTSRYYPSSGIAANHDVPAEIIEKVKKALIDFAPLGRQADRLYGWDKTEMPNGFVEADDEDYTELRDWSKKLGLID